MFPEIPEMLTFLSEQNMFLGIVTSNLVKQPKRHPKSILTILEKFQLDPKETIYVGDSKIDMLAAKSAGVLFVYASWDNYDDSITYDFLLNTPDNLKIFVSFSK